MSLFWYHGYTSITGLQESTMYLAVVQVIADHQFSAVEVTSSGCNPRIGSRDID